MIKKECSSEFGFAAILALFMVTGMILIVTFSLNSIILTKRQIGKNLVSSAQSYYSAESGIEDAVLRKLKNYNLPSGVLNLDGASITQSISQTGNVVTVNSLSSLSQDIRKLKAILVITTDNISFYYGVQVGEGGIGMSNNSTISGNIYSNGKIEGATGAKITGDAYVSGGYKIKNVTVGLSAHANTIESSQICGDAYYQTIDASSLNFLNNPTAPPCSSPLTLGTAHPGSSDPVAQAMPISSTNIANWEASAVAGGVYSDAAHCSPTGNITIGPAKLACDFTPAVGIKITVSGTVWVEGDINLANSIKMELANSYGANSGVMIADKPSSQTTKGVISTGNNVIICGSSGYNSSTGACNASNGSYLLLLSTRSNGEAVDISNNVIGGIFYAANGSADISNNTSIKEVTAYQLNLNNNAAVTYESGLASAAFSSGPGAGWKINSWNETQ